MKIAEKESITRIVIIFLIIAVIVLISVFNDKGNSPQAVTEYDTIQLFNGVNLENWKMIVEGDSISEDQTFTVKDGNILISGQPFGYMRTTDMYSEYQLLAEWRWPQEPGNSGVFLHIKKDSIWPVCLECQLKSGNAGDFVAFPGFTFNEHQDKDNWIVTKMDNTSEKLAGEWNLYDIRVKNDSVSVYVNGVLQNIASGATSVNGYIALQSEGAPVEFRNVQLITEKLSSAE